MTLQLFKNLKNMAKRKISLEQLFEESRERQIRKKQQEKLKYKKAQEAIKKALADIQSKEQKKAAQNAQKQPQIKISRTIAVYKTRFIERFTDDELYSSRQELMEAEKRGEGRINWDVWDMLINNNSINFILP